MRARVVDPTTGKMKELKKVLPQADEATAYKWLNDQKARVRDCRMSAPRQQTRFCDYATSLFEKKVKTGDIRSAKGRYRWKGVLQHLIVGTSGRRERTPQHPPWQGEFVRFPPLQAVTKCLNLRVKRVEAFPERSARYDFGGEVSGEDRGVVEPATPVLSRARRSPYSFSVRRT